MQNRGALPAAARDLAENGQNTLKVLVYASSAYPTRPASSVLPAGCARYIGPTQPSDWLSGDEWINNS